VSCGTHPAHLDQVVDHAVVAHFRNTRGAAPGLYEGREGGNERREGGREGGREGAERYVSGWESAFQRRGRACLGYNGRQGRRMGRTRT